MIINEGRRGEHNLEQLEHPCAFPAPESKPGHQHAGKTLVLAMFVCVLRAPLKRGSQHLLLLLLGSQVLGLANLQCGASIFQFLDGKVDLYC